MVKSIAMPIPKTIMMVESRRAEGGEKNSATISAARSKMEIAGAYF